MQSLADLLAIQEDLEHIYADFLSSLDPERTITLRQLILEPSSYARLRAPWLDHNLVVRRFEALGTFLARIGNHPRLGNGRLRLIFFQPNSDSADWYEHRVWTAKSSYYAQRLGRLPPHVNYLHTDTKWLGVIGTLRKKRRRILPLGNSANLRYRDVMRGQAKTLEESEAVQRATLGYKVPDWSRWLGVGNATATDYLLRPVIHDIGHSRLPSLNPSIDSLHNATMLYAMGEVDTVHEDPWETLVHRECIDPYFYLDGEFALADAKGLELTPLQSYYRKRLCRWYMGSEHARKKAWLWNLEPESSLDQARGQMRAVLEEMLFDGFKRYDLMP